VGGARTALFNYLFARRHGGTFILRLEDTDPSRSSEVYTASIFDALRWLGLTWTEGPDVGGPCGPYRQSARRAIYDEYVGRLLAADRAYECFCTPAELEAKRDAARARGLAPRYDGTCARLAEGERRRRREGGQLPCVRFRMDATAELTFRDLIRGPVEIDARELDDFVIARPDGAPTYNFVCVIDDATMAISHVIRGEDHISNTPRQLAVYYALGLTPPAFAHVPLLLGPDKSRLSKRHGAKAVVEYREEGYLAEALVNFLALLGWSYDDARELFTLDELTRYFALERVAKKGAVFDVEKLTWMNGVYLRGLTPDELFARARPWLTAAALVADGDDAAKLAFARDALALEQEKLKTLAEAPAAISFFFADDLAYDAKAEDNLRKLPGGAATLAALRETLAAVAASAFTAEELERVIRAFAAERGLAAGKVIHALRAALSGRSVGPSLFAMAALLGKERVLRLIDKAAAFLGSV
jgi:glutamyl-tRNA synthetase